jgi:hypothetical protein
VQLDLPDESEAHGIDVVVGCDVVGIEEQVRQVKEISK